MYIATVDGGTTNTRVFIWHNGHIIGEASAPVGVRNTAIDGMNAALVAAVRQVLCEAVSQAGIDIADISLILAAGMLTSNVGLLEIPHITAPAGLEELAGAMVCTAIPDIAEQPIWCIPGVKTIRKQSEAEKKTAVMDMMRGEETEAIGLLLSVHPDRRAVFVLPGSHNKYVLVDEMQRIQGCMTTLAGEILRSLTFDTVLSDTVCRSFASEFDEASFLQGVSDRETYGFLRAAFMTRIRGMFCGDTPLRAQNYLLGIVLADDMHALASRLGDYEWDTSLFIIAGKPVVQKAYICLFHRHGYDAAAVPLTQQRGLSEYGAIELARRRGLL